MKQVPDRGRIVIVNFEKAGNAMLPEMDGTMRPCIVVQNNALDRGPLITIVPISTTPPETPMKQHHKLHHLSFRGWPMQWDGQGKERWAKCDYVTTVSLARCTDPYSKDPYQNRKYTKVKIIKADLEAIDRCVLWALGINASAISSIATDPLLQAAAGAEP